ncbi:hypothetical protein HDU97_001755 [Phlyctochytrium planicorne]|nr:hypothetical protein HDU97_001755 [Phlyctochytrium planicorne]
MFCKLGFEQVAESLNPEESIKLQLVAKYLDFKIGEVWDEIASELYVEGIRPVTPDVECISTAKAVIIEKAQVVQTKQKDILQRKSKRENEEQKAFLDRCFFSIVGSSKEL